jgi:hypothetical protein
MAEPRRNDEELVDNPRADETTDTEHNRSYDEAVRGSAVDLEEDVDPDSAESDVDRDDM